MTLRSLSRSLVLLFILSLVVFLTCVVSAQESELYIKDDVASLSENKTVKGTAPKTLGLGALGKGVAGERHVPVSTVALFTFLMAAATGLGTIPFFFFNLEPAWQGICNGIACGVMLAASFDLIVEGQAHGGGGCVVVGILLGGLFIYVSQKVLESFGDVKMMDLKNAGARRMVLIIAIMTLHSFGEGSGVGVSFAGPKGYSQGLLVTIAIAIHNIPEGLAVSMVMAARGVHPRNAMLWSIFTSLPQPLVAIPAFLSAEIFNQILPICVGFAAGCMIWIVFGEVMPESLKDSNPSHVASAATISVAVLEGIGTLLQGLDAPPGWEQIGPLLYSLLFALGPFLGGFLIVLLNETVPLHSSLFSGLSAGAMIALGFWRPLQLTLGAQISPLITLALLYTGAMVYSGLASLSKGSLPPLLPSSKSPKTKGETKGELEEKPSFGSISRVKRAAMLACSAVVCQTLTEGLMLGIATPNVQGLGFNILLPAGLHGFPRGIAVACAMYGVNKDAGTALLAAALTGLAAPLGAWASLIGGLADYRALDYWMVLACGGLIPAALGEVLPRSLGLDRRRTLLGLGLGLFSVLSGLLATHLLCLSTPYCSSAPEAVS